MTAEGVDYVCDGHVTDAESRSKFPRKGIYSAGQNAVELMAIFCWSEARQRLEDTRRASACRVAFEVNTIAHCWIAATVAWHLKPRALAAGGERARFKEFRRPTAMGLKRT